jgi:hypothetical protein
MQAKGIEIEWSWAPGFLLLDEEQHLKALRRVELCAIPGHTPPSRSHVHAHVGTWNANPN